MQLSSARALRSRDLASEAAGLRSQLDRALQVNREIDHRAANSLLIVATFLRLQSKDATSPHAREALAEAASRVSALARVHHHLHGQWSSDRVDLSRVLSDLGADLAQSLGIACRVEVEPVVVPAADVRHLVVAVNELVVNARKHAAAGSRGLDGADGSAAVEVAVRGGVAEDGRLRVEVSDNGGGLPDGFDPAAGRGLGMAVVRDAAERLGGELAAWTDGGARFRLTVPLG